MTLDELETFVAIARSGSFTEAARRLARTQPAISRRIHQLEVSLDATLFERAGRGVDLSAAGRALLPHAEAALAATADARRAVDDAAHADGEGPLRLAIVGTLADTHLVDALRAFESQHPDTRITVATATSRQVSALVRSGDADLGLRYFTDPDAGLVSTPLGGEKLCLVVPAGHRLRQKRLRSLDRLAGEQWLAFPPERGQSDSWGHLVARIAAAAGAPPDAITTVDSLTAQKRLVEAGMGIALMPESAVREELRLGSLRAIDLQGQSMLQPVVAVQRARGFEDATTQSFVHFLRAAMPERPRPDRGRERRRPLDAGIDREPPG
jgi:DNA-binding transcriptional LysR family regulator